MEPRSNWFNSTGFENKPVHSQGAAIVHTIDNDSDASALNIQIHAWPIDRDFHNDPFASPTEFYKAYFLHCNQVELGLEPTKAESHAKQPAHYVSQITASETTKEEACEQSRIKQEPDKIEEVNSMLIPGNPLAGPSAQSPDRIGIRDNHIRCSHCKKAIEGEVHFGLCAICAFCVKTKCELCSQVIIDTETHMKCHSKEALFECIVDGCGRAFTTEVGNLTHRIKAHAAVFYSERRERRRRRRNASKWFSDPGHSLSEADDAAALG